MGLSLLLALRLVSLVPDAPTAHHFPLLTTAAVERLLLPPAGAPYVVTMDHLASQISVRPSKPMPTLGRSLESTLCQATGEVAGNWLLHCKSDQFDAYLSDGDKALTISLLRGLPWRAGDDGPPRIFYPESPGHPDPCPGTDAASRGECALASGQPAKAAALFHRALNGPANDFATVRLGDLALLEGDPEAALGEYAQAGSVGPFGHLAAERIAELTGDEVTLSSFGSLEDEAPVVRPELALRLARWRAFRGDPLGAATDLLGGEDLSTCTRDTTLCRRLLLAALRQSKADGFKAVALYLRLPERQVGPLAVELAEAAAESVAALGAPRFGANLRSALFPQVPKDRQLAYLRRTAELFLQANDTTRAEVICDFARTRFGKRGGCGDLLGDRQVSGSDGRGPSRHHRPRSLKSDVERDVADAARAAAQPVEATGAGAPPKPSKEVVALPAASKP